MDARRSACTYKQTHRSTSKESLGSTCTDAPVSMLTNISTDITGVHGITYLYIYNKGISVPGFTPTDDSMVNMGVRGKTNVYDKYRSYGTKWYIATDVVGNIRKGIRYTDDIQKGS